MNDFEQIFVEEDEVDLRLDQLLASRFKGSYSRAYFQKLIDQGLVLVNGEPSKKRIKPRKDDEIEVEFSRLTGEGDDGLKAENIPLDILYEDEDLLVVNKPAGLVVHPAPGNWTGTFVNALIFYCQGIADQEPGSLRPGIVHRLDKDTSGVLIAAKNSWMQSKLIELFSNRQVIKEYLAITIGNPGASVIDAPIGRHLRHRQKMAIVEGGRQAVSHVEPINVGKLLTLSKVRIETGRTHQIRVHLLSKVTPVLGDPIYGNAAFNQKIGAKRQMLHAEVLGLVHPKTGKKMIFKAPLPSDFLHFSSQI